MEVPIHEDATLTSVRNRSQAYLGYLFWVCVALCLLWAANAVTSLLGNWVALLRGMRGTLGLAVPGGGPDYFVIGGVLAVVVLSVIGLGAAYSGYRAAWKRRLRSVWGTLP